MRGAQVLRSFAVAIAVAAAIDPSLTLSARIRPSISVVGDRAVVDRALGGDYTIVNGFDSTAAAIIVVGDRYPAEAIPPNARVSTVAVARPSGVRIASLTAPRSIPSGTSIHLEAELIGSRGMATEAKAMIGPATLARASHAWMDDRPWRAALDVVPVGEPPFVITVEAGESPGARATAVVDLTERLPVLVYEMRPSWIATFVRRALESDPRFAVSSVDVASRDIAVKTADTPTRLQRADLGRFRAVIVGGLDRLSAADAATLNAFMTEDGGAVALLPDARVDSPAMRALVPGSPGTETLLEKPAALTVEPPLASIQASELLRVAAPPDARVLARSADAAMVWAEPRGEGRLLVSGAMDAWRFRGGASFDRFWQSAVGGAALAVRPPLFIDVVPPDEAHADSRIHVRVRSAAVRTNGVAVSASLRTGEIVRLWPDAEPGSFSGVLSPSAPGLNRVDVVATTDGGTFRASAPFVSGADVASDDPEVPLSLLSASHEGVHVSANNLSPLQVWLRETIAAKTREEQRHPMRSPWWMVPFAGCLCGEWWMRRRAGLR